MSTQIDNSIFYTTTSSSLTAWGFGVASIIKALPEASNFMALAEQTFTNPGIMEFALIKEAASLISEYRFHSYENNTGVTSIPLFISSRSCNNPLGVEVEFNPRAWPFLHSLRSIMLDLHKEGMLNPQNLLASVNAFKFPIGRPCFVLQMDVKLLEILSTEPNLYTLQTHTKLESQNLEFEGALARLNKNRYE